VDQSTPDTNNYLVEGFNTTLLVALSTADTNKWSTLLEKRHGISKSEATPVDYERTGPILQRQRRLPDSQALMLRDRYKEGATVYELANEFSIRRATVSERLKKAGVSMRRPEASSLTLWLGCMNQDCHLLKSGLGLVHHPELCVAIYSSTVFK